MMTIYPTRIFRLAGVAVCLAILSLPSAAAPSRDASIEARIASCDAATRRSAIDEMLGAPQSLREPMLMFQAALAERLAGRREEAAFLYLAARLRTSRQILFEQGDRPQLLAIMVMTVGPLVMPVLDADPGLARRVVARTIDWDRAMPDRFRDRPEARSGEIARKIAEIDAGLARLPDQIAANPAGIAKARADDERAERQVGMMHAERCRAGTQDPLKGKPVQH